MLGWSEQLPILKGLDQIVEPVHNQHQSSLRKEGSVRMTAVPHYSTVRNVVSGCGRTVRLYVVLISRSGFELPVERPDTRDGAWLWADCVVFSSCSLD